MTGQGTTIVAGLAAGGVHLGARFGRNAADVDGNMRVIVATFILIALLLLIGQFWPEGGRGLAVLVMVSSMAINGRDLATLLGSLVEEPPRKVGRFSDG